MSKRIIYLLLFSLMFLNCKENGLDNILGTVPNNEFDNSPDTETGLVEDEAWLNENSDMPIKNEPIPYLQTTAGYAYFRNPVVVVMGKSDIVVFAEKRYQTSGSENDVGVTGSTAADIVYVSSQNSGKSWDVFKIAGRSSESTGGNDAVASPVVFKIDDKTVVVVASAGAGLSRIGTSYRNRNPKSELKYAIGTYNSDSGTFSWTKEWTDMTDIVKTATENVKKEGNAKSYDYKQFGTLAAKGFVKDKTLYLAVTLVDQGRSGGYANNAFGNVMVKGNYNTSDVTWSVINNTAIGFSTVLDGRSGYLESVAVGLTTDNKVYYLAGGSSYYGSSTGVHIGEGKEGEQPTASGQVPGSEGSFSYLEVLNWKGLKTYNPTNYDMSNGTKQRLFAHVRGLNNRITIRALEDSQFRQKTGSTEYIIQGYPTDNTILAKSSSMDILGDGTIVMVAEQGRKEKEYYLVFKRFTQKFLAMKLGLE